MLHIKTNFMALVILLASTNTFAFTCYPHSSLGMADANQFLCREGYAVGYSYQYRQPFYVTAFMRSDLTRKRQKRTEDFREDKEIPKRYRATLDDFYHNRFKLDRGHLFASADADFSHKSTSQSFLLSNMSPQIGVGFNRGGFRRVEKNVRKCVEKMSALQVITGVIFQKGKPVQTIGKNRVAIPHAYYKILLARNNNKIETMAIIMPHRPFERLNQSNFVTVDQIEKITGLDFFNRISEERQRKFESKKANFCRL